MPSLPPRLQMGRSSVREVPGPKVEQYAMANSELPCPGSRFGDEARGTHRHLPTSRSGSAICISGLVFPKMQQSTMIGSGDRDATPAFPASLADDHSSVALEQQETAPAPLIYDHSPEPASSTRSITEEVEFLEGRLRAVGHC
eukprot:1149610-Rhodomonas_salina.1